MEVRTYAIFGCGLMDDEIFDSRLFAYNAERKSDVADYLWWNDGGVYSGNVHFSILPLNINLFQPYVRRTIGVLIGWEPPGALGK